MKSLFIVFFLCVLKFPQSSSLSKDDLNPSIGSFASGRLDLFVKGPNDHLYQKTFLDGSWQADWSDLGGSISSSPTVCSWGPGRYDVFARGNDNKLHHRFYELSSGVWSSWEIFSNDDDINSAPSAASWGLNRLDVFALNAAGELLHKLWDGQSWWNNWENLGGKFISSPASASWGLERLDIFAINEDYSYSQKFFQRSDWSSLINFGGKWTSAFSCTSRGLNLYDIFVKGTNNALWHRSYENVWHDWECLAGDLVSAPTAVSWGKNRIDVVVEADEGALWHRTYEYGCWNDWVKLGQLPGT